MADKDTIEVYKIFVDSSLRLTELRHSMNKFNLTVVSGIAAAAWVVISLDKVDIKVAIGVALTAASLIGIIGRSWRQTICYYRDLNSAKFKVIHKMEQALPLQPFTDEWAIIKSNSRCKNNLTKWEEFLPKVLSNILWPAVVCLAAFLWSLLCFYDKITDLLK